MAGRVGGEQGGAEITADDRGLGMVGGECGVRWSGIFFFPHVASFKIIHTSKSVSA